MSARPHPPPLPGRKAPVPAAGAARRHWSASPLPAPRRSVRPDGPIGQHRRAEDDRLRVRHRKLHRPAPRATRHSSRSVSGAAYARAFQPLQRAGHDGRSPGRSPPASARPHGPGAPSTHPPPAGNGPGAGAGREGPDRRRARPEHRADRKAQAVVVGQRPLQPHPPGQFARDVAVRPPMRRPQHAPEGDGRYHAQPRDRCEERQDAVHFPPASRSGNREYGPASHPAGPNAGTSCRADAAPPRAGHGHRRNRRASARCRGRGFPARGCRRWADGA